MRQPAKVRRLRHEVFIRADPVVVFAALTDPRQLERRLAVRAEADPRPGGVYRCVMTPGGRHTEEGAFLAVEPPRLLRLRSRLFEPEPTVTEYALEPQGGGTRVTVVQSGFGLGGAWDEAFDEDDNGWPYHLAALKWAIEEGFDQRTLPYLGISYERTPGGLAVVGVLDGTPAQRSGLLPGDRITRVNGRPVSGLLSLAEALRLTPVGPDGVPVEVAVARGGREVVVVVRGVPKTA